MGWLVWTGVIAAGLFALARTQLSFKIWTVMVGVVLFMLGLTGYLAFIPGIVLWGLFLLLMVPLNITSLRQSYLSDPMLDYIRDALPPMSETEKTAIEAGTVWWEAELFCGKPRWDQLLKIPAPELSSEEQDFIDGPVEELCAKLDDWQITHELNDLPPQVWDFLKQQRFFGMIIPKEYGGRGFSAFAHSSVVMKIASRSDSAAVTVMVPNSLGPAELLLHYGTDEQRQYYLPRLARGEEVPCFALTSPVAGSDAGGIPDFGVVCKGEFEGKDVLGLRCTWDKRYITLAPVATVLGLAFKAYDPDHLLGETEDLGITCALIPTGTAGVDIGRRHYPLGAAFQNGPTLGQDVFIPFDWVIGGQQGIGRGWQMLMESLSVGRGISLPSLGAGGGKFTSRMTGAYARVRKQFNLPIGKFEGVEEALARIGGLSYMMDAARQLTAAAIDMGEKPSVVSAIVKYYNTDGLRQVVNDAMDIHGGRGICNGPSNYLAGGYEAVPIAITVEGANILTRSMIIFGQGALRCHPYLVDEIKAASNSDKSAASVTFDGLLFKHLGFTMTNAARALVYGLSGGRLAPKPVAGPVARYYQRLERMSASFAFLADCGLLFLGGALKRKEKLSGRFADALSYMFLCSAALKRFEDQGRPDADLPLVEWVAKYCLYNVQNALDEIMRNFPSLIVGQILRAIIFPLGHKLRYPNDALGHRVASILMQPSAARDRLTEGIFITDNPDDVTGRVEYALHQVIAAEAAEQKLKMAGLQAPAFEETGPWLDEAIAKRVIDAQEAAQVREARKATRAAIMVDDFAPSSHNSRQAKGKAA
ncbi:MAG: acyl-CoA dehydrogenase [Gammaproteobacteria bacterium]|nr:acyl-CoA dehydrogenase [Gammaproteobacteria bacterium]